MRFLQKHIIIQSVLQREVLQKAIRKEAHQDTCIRQGEKIDTNVKSAIIILWLLRKLL